MGTPASDFQPALADIARQWTSTEAFSERVTHFAEGWLEYPQYTRPPVFRKRAVPAVLLSGDHERIAEWRKAQSVANTKASRPDLIASRDTNGQQRG